MRRTIEKYLSSKESNSYTDLDKILEMHLDGEIKRILSSYEGVGIYPSFFKEYKTIQIVYKFHNIYVTIDFFEEKYSVTVYPAGTNADDLKKSFIDYAYPANFNLKQLVEEINEKIKTHPSLSNTASNQKKSKMYSLIAWISLLLPILTLGSIGLYCVITENTIQGNIWWEVFFIIIPLIVWFVFRIKSDRLK